MMQEPVPVFEIENLCAVNCQAPDITPQIRPYLTLEEGTILIRFRNYELHSGGAALLTFVNAQYVASYFSIYIRNKKARKFWVFRPKCRYSVGINRDVYTFITTFDCRKQPLFQ